MNHFIISLFCLLLLVPTPTIIYSYLKSFTDSGSISVFDVSFFGQEAQLVLFLFILLSSSLFAFSLQKLVLSYKQNLA